MDDRRWTACDALLAKTVWSVRSSNNSCQLDFYAVQGGQELGQFVLPSFRPHSHHVAEHLPCDRRLTVLGHCIPRYPTMNEDQHVQTRTHGARGHAANAVVR